jgi:ABC-2 type transport system ATP-binding protein
MLGTPRSDRPLVALVGVSKRYGAAARWVLREVTVAVAAGTLVELRGANGSGKSTLLRLLAGATVPTRGRRRAVAAVGYAPDALLPPPPFSAAEFLHHHARIRGLDSAGGAREARAVAEQLGFADLLDDRLSALSQGTLQKVVVTQALLGEPSLLLLDEPFDGLDSDAKRALAEVLRERVAAGSGVAYSVHGTAPEGLRPDHDWRLSAARLSTERTRQDSAALADLPGVLAVCGEEDSVIVRVERVYGDRVLAELLRRGWHIESVAQSGGALRIDARSGLSP